MSSAPAAGPAIVAPETRNLRDLADTLAQWLSVRMPEAKGIGISNLSYPLGAGLSHETILFDAEWTEGTITRRSGLVVRIKPLRNTVYQDDMFDEQYRLMKLMHDQSQVRIAAPLWFEEDASLLGAPFFVMTKVSGRVTVSYPPYSKQGWLVDEAGPTERRRMWEDAVSQLALIQHVPVTDASFLVLPGGETGFDQEADRWRRYMEWTDAAGEERLLRSAFDRLMAVLPDNRTEGIVWGDARLGNMMIGSDFRVSAVMDWEQPSLGGALHDLGWWLLSDYNYTIAQGIAPLDGMGTREETIALWEAVSGKSAADIGWYQAFAQFKQDCLALRMSRTNELVSRAASVAPGTRTMAALDML